MRDEKRHSRHGRNMVDIRLRNHSRHRLLHRPLPKLIQTMLIPHRLEIKVRPVQERLEECYTPRMRNSCIAL